MATTLSVWVLAAAGAADGFVVAPPRGCGGGGRRPPVRLDESGRRCLVGLLNLQGGASGGGSGGLCPSSLSSTSSSPRQETDTAARASVVEVPTAPIPGMKPGTSGLRKKVEVWQGENYVENFIQALIDTAAAAAAPTGAAANVPETYVRPPETRRLLFRTLSF
jgi:hypothetical protein